MANFVFLLFKIGIYFGTATHWMNNDGVLEISIVFYCFVMRQIYCALNITCKLNKYLIVLLYTEIYVDL